MRLRLFLAAAVTVATGNVDIDPSMFQQEAPSRQNEGAEVEYEKLVWKEPTTPANNLLLDTFQGERLEGWHKLKSEKFTGEWKHTVRQHDWVVGDKGLQMSTDSAFHGLVHSMNAPFSFEPGKDFFATFEVQQETPVNCGGAYFKLFHTDKTKDNEATSFDEHTPYSIMFGPDKCGYMTNQVHFIIKYPKPLTIEGETPYHEARQDPPVRLPAGKEAHQYGFGLYKDGNVRVWVDGQENMKGTIDMLFGKYGWKNDEEIDDPDDFKPADWVDQPTIPDPDAVKPEDWDDEAPEFVIDEDAVMPEGWKEDAPAYIENPDAEKPEDWDEEEDGEWLAPKMRNPECYVGCGPWTPPSKPNPEYKGRWEAPLIDNPAYKGIWRPAKIPNPNHWSIQDPRSVLQPFNAIGFELWTVDSGSMFDNVFLTTDEQDFMRFIQETYMYKHDTELRNLEREVQEGKKQTEFDPELVDSVTSRFSASSYALMGAAVAIPAALLYWNMRRRKPVATTEEAAAAKKDDDKPAAKTSVSSNKENKDVEESDDDKSGPTSATEQPTRQRRKNSAQQQTAD